MPNVLISPPSYKGTNVTADTLVKTGPGVLHTISFSQNDAAPTAGSIVIYDNTSASGTVLYSETFTTTVFRGYTVRLNRPFSNGIYVDFTTTADVNCSLSYK